MTPQEWFSNPLLVEELKVEMEKPIWRTAFEVWRELSYASLYADTPPSAITGHGDAIAGKITGFEKARQSLSALATAIPPEPDRLIETYGVTKPEHATE